MNNIGLFPAGIRLFPDSGGLPGNIRIQYTCPKCGQVVNTEVGVTDLLQPLSLPCTNAGCPGYTLGIHTAFSAFGMALTGAPPEITLFDAEAEAQQVAEAVREHEQVAEAVREHDEYEREFARMYWTIADILDEDFGVRPDDRRWTPERAARLLERVEDDLMDAMSQAGREVLEYEIIREDAMRVFVKRCPHCGSSDVQFYGQQTVEVVEDWSEGDSRDNFEFPEGPSGKWQNCTGHCLTCDAEWEVIPDSDSE